jgi:hypothetical protein
MRDVDLPLRARYYVLLEASKDRIHVIYSTCVFTRRIERVAMTSYSKSVAIYSIISSNVNMDCLLRAIYGLTSNFRSNKQSCQINSDVT